MFEDKELYDKALKELDTKTTIFCVCGKLASGLHTNSCSKFQRELKRIYERLLKEKNNGKQ